MRKNLFVNTCNVRGLSTSGEKLRFFYGELRPSEIFILTETNLSVEKLQDPDHAPPPHICARTTRDPARRSGTGSGVTIILDAELVSGSEESFYSELVPGFLSRVVLSLGGSIFLIYGVYCPPANTEKAGEIIDALLENVSSTEHTHLFIAGDLNAALREQDRTSRSQGQAKQQDTMWTKLAHTLSLTDVLAHKHPDKIVYTRTSDSCKSAIDHVLVSELPLRQCTYAETHLGKWKVADHYPIHTAFKLGNIPVPSFEPTVFRVPTHELANQELEIAAQSLINAHLSDPKAAEDMAEVWIGLKRELAALIVAFTSRKDAMARKQMRKLCEMLKTVKDTKPVDARQAQNLYAREQRLNKALRSLERQRQKRRVARLNSVAQTEMEELTYTTYRLAQRKLSGAGRNASALRHPVTRELHTDTKSMLEVARAFYQQLFESEQEEADSENSSREATEIISKLPLPSLTTAQRTELLRPASEEEVRGLFSRLKPGKAPGHDGLGNDAYKAYAELLAKPITQLIQQFQARPDSIPEDFFLYIYCYKEKRRMQNR